jgi:hypothetical protein
MAQHKEVEDRASGPSERRSAHRFELRWPVRINGVESAGLPFEATGTVENISSRGALVYIERSPQVGSQLNVSIKVPFKRERWMQYTAEVMRVEDKDDRTEVAIRFSDPKPGFLVA